MDYKNKQIFILFGITILLLIALFAAAFFFFSNSSQQSQSELPIPTPYPSLDEAVKSNRVAPTQISQIGNEFDESLQNLSSLEDMDVLSEDKRIYTYSSPLITRKNEILTQNNRVIFERILIPEDKNDPGYVIFSEYTRLFGEPNETVVGSKFYGQFIQTRIYADKGFALIGNPLTDEIYEVHVFTPMTIEEYENAYGSDLDEDGYHGH